MVLDKLIRTGGQSLMMLRSINSMTIAIGNDLEENKPNQPNHYYSNWFINVKPFFYTRKARKSGEQTCTFQDVNQIVFDW